MGVYSLPLSTLHSSHNKSFIFSYSLNKFQMSILRFTGNNQSTSPTDQYQAVFSLPIE